VGPRTFLPDPMNHRHSRHTRSTLLLFPLLLGGCDGSTPTALPSQGDSLLEPGTVAVLQDSELGLSAESEAFRAGGAVALVLENHGEETVAFNLCYYALERMVSDEWVRAGEQEERICNRIVLTLEPGGAARYDTRLPSTLPRAVYRLRIAVYLTETRELRGLATSSFFAGG
jgi:hypothetical protein